MLVEFSEHIRILADRLDEISMQGRLEECGRNRELLSQSIWDVENYIWGNIEQFPGREILQQLRVNAAGSFFPVGEAKFVGYEFEWATCFHCQSERKRVVF
jgi:hypothetical protein